MGSLQKLLRKQRCLAIRIQSLEPHLHCEAEVTEVCYNIVCKYGEMLRSNQEDIEKVASETGHSVQIETYDEAKENIFWLKSILQRRLASHTSHTFSTSRHIDSSHKTAFRKQLCILITVAAMEPANCISEEEYELYQELLTHIREEFDKSQSSVERYTLNYEDYETQIELGEQFQRILKDQEMKLASNIAVIRSLDF
ncbi:hypothetical protein U1Q18_050760 [Sarracenia purpurea var. burkii]